MSIFCSTFSIGDEHKPRCARMKKMKGYSKTYEYDDSKPCTCGSAPFVYQGSHVLPKMRDERGGSLDLAAIPGYVRRGKDDDRPMHPYWPWLRIGLCATNGSTLILSRKQAEALRDELTTWLKLSQKK